jgi:hypothetical protein
MILVKTKFWQNFLRNVISQNGCFTNDDEYNIIMPIARQRLGKLIRAVTLSTTEGHPLLGNGPINTHS